MVSLVVKGLVPAEVLLVKWQGACGSSLLVRSAGRLWKEQMDNLGLVLTDQFEEVVAEA